ncbi:MAG: cytochrome C [Phycisphaerales bacterium]|nr:cytochrome C [Phycisphaerales bacterium]
MKIQTHRLLVAVATLVVAGCAATEHKPQATTQVVESTQQPRIAADSRIAAGRYLVRVGGCNDCHTAGYMQAPSAIPESQWLTGVPVGWQGPWGTTYAGNLRLFVQQIDEDAWVKYLHTRTARPPMPWTAVNAMSDEDLRALYVYIKSLGPAGELAPAFVPPGEQPKTPFLNLNPVMPQSSSAPANESEKQHCQ